MHHLLARITSKHACAQGAWEIVLHAPEIARCAAPGQFVHVRPPGVGCDPLLRRPLAIARAEGDSLVLIVDVVGRGTRALAARRPGDEVDLIGPLGNGWPALEGVSGPIALVAGGTGVASLMSFHHAFADKLRLHPLLGARTAQRLLGAEYFRQAPNTRLATDDATAGFCGTVVELLRQAWDEIRPQAVLACGPEAMLAAVAELARQRGVCCYVSLEQRMGCGFGVCMGCAVPLARGGYARVCVDGPVFEAAEVAWE